MGEPIKTELVNFSMLERGASAEQRAELTRHVVSLFRLTSKTCSKEQMDTYDAVLLRLADFADDPSRRYMAEELAELRRAPETIVLRLANDIIDVAMPLLERSTLLRDPDLVEIARHKDQEHMLAIAGRDVLSEMITDVLVDRGDPSVKRRVAGNQGATFSEQGMATLVDAAAQDERLQMELGRRNDLQEEAIVKLISVATQQVRQELLDQGETGTADKIPEAARLAAQQMSNEYWLSRYDFETAHETVMGMASRDQVTEQVLRRFAEEDRFPEAVAAFAYLGGISLEAAKHWMVRTETDPFIIVARACGLSPMTVQALIKVGPWRHRLSAEERMTTFNRFQALTMEKARHALGLWTDQRIAS
ncbi:DUF2336 domain-containing protein [Breoghania sp. L-A4]|uniref:DUF2336 domain-containing protein n=1 Tax=Breoghania sp. L-A4 TaxID=2304600 RepID=UPI000E35D5D4|nr:DUF2336 domain-containing protein [Breoghania sp. L-A4]AXS42682.1 DUF2336 domain-containing protein [Breoghania sp. L-A4]